MKVYNGFSLKYLWCKFRIMITVETKGTSFFRNLHADSGKADG